MVIVPNENDLLKLSSLQKDLCKVLKNKLQSSSDFVIPVIPLWLKSDEFSNIKTTAELKEFSKTITKVQLCDFFTKETEKGFYIMCRASVEMTSPRKNSFTTANEFSRAEINSPCTETNSPNTNSSTRAHYFSMPFILLQAANKTYSPSEGIKKAVEEFFKKNFPLPLKIFRAGIETSGSDFNLQNSMDIQDSVWVKTSAPSKE